MNGVEIVPSGEAWVGRDEILNNLFMRLGEDFAKSQVRFPTLPRQGRHSPSALLGARRERRKP